MSHTIVLKLGGSVLRSADTLPQAVHEVYRWRRDGFRVVAVVSALAGRTDALLAECRAQSASPHATAARVALGEGESAALLGLQLDAAGVDAAVLAPAAFALRAGGDPLDADPVALDHTVLDAALATHGCVVVPGFVALDAQGRTVLLGRGGSDLTALFVAHALGARCRLLKDIDGLYDRDPAKHGGARRYARATWDDALATDGSIVQHKAIAFARRHALSFELGRCNGTAPTVVDGGPSASATERDRGAALRVAVLGAGTVGGGVLQCIARLPESFTVAAIAVRDAARARDVALPDVPILDALDAARCGADVVVECIGGDSIARDAIEAALRAGADVVTANKAVLARHGMQLAALARRHGRYLLASAAVGGSAPVLEAVARGHACGRTLARFRAVLNGTTNHVLEDLRRGLDLDDALAAARANGFAEADPSRDLDGRDAADKLVLVAAAAGIALAPERVARVPLDASLVAPPGAPHRVRQIATLERGGDGWHARVTLDEVDAPDPLHALPAEWNAAHIEWTDGSADSVRGRGAGRRPTAEAVLGDLLALQRSPARRGSTVAREPRFLGSAPR